MKTLTKGEFRMGGKSDATKVALLEQRVAINENLCKERDAALSCDIDKGDGILRTDINGMGTRIDQVRDSLNSFKFWLIFQAFIGSCSIIGIFVTWFLGRK
jgi:hypothetical protein